jgi:ABC-2 type transport system ATP-binding protein
MKQDVLELETDNVVETMEVLSNHHIETAIFGSTLHITVEKAEEGMEKLAVLLQESGIPVKRCEKIAPSLEDVFVTLIEAS